MRAEGFLCSLDVHYGGLGISIAIFFITKTSNLFSTFSIFGHFSKPWIRIGIQPKMLDPDPESINPDPESMTLDPLKNTLVSGMEKKCKLNYCKVAYVKDTQLILTSLGQFHIHFCVKSL